jgi:hypothetical protein
MWGRATLTMVASSTIMSWAVAMTARARPSRRGAADPVLGEAATDATAVLTSRAAEPLKAAWCPVSGGVADKVNLLDFERTELSPRPVKCHGHGQCWLF